MLSSCLFCRIFQTLIQRWLQNMIIPWTVPSFSCPLIALLHLTLASKPRLQNSWLWSQLVSGPSVVFVIAFVELYCMTDTPFFECKHLVVHFYECYHLVVHFYERYHLVVHFYERYHLVVHFYECYHLVVHFYECYHLVVHFYECYHLVWVEICAVDYITLSVLDTGVHACVRVYVYMCIRVTCTRHFVSPPCAYHLVSKLLVHLLSMLLSHYTVLA